MLPRLSLPAIALAALVPATHVAAQRVDFSRDIRPLLSDRCFKCHGFDAKARKAELRLDTWEGMTREREGRHPVVPGDPDHSALVERVTSHDPEHFMPPPSSGLALTDPERALLRRWIEQGAEYAPHWAFTTPREVTPPRLDDAASPNALDAFIVERLAAANLAPSPEADRETLIRRASLDLIGLPPTPEETAAFLADKAPGAYERVVDRLLASPHFGERMALVWLDAARYADTNGYHHDNVRTAWPYRDWVIRAFNENLPYDTFLVEQLAGDLLPNATDQQRIASGFCRMHNINDEGGAIDAEYRVEAICDRIETVSTALMGLTMACARCHDHKYDPLTQEDYYSLYAFFGSVEERGVYNPVFEEARAYPARIPYRDAELQARTDAATAARDAAAAERTAAVPAIDAERAAAERALLEALDLQWVAADVVAATAESGAVMTVQEDGSVLAAGSGDKDRHVITLRTDATGLRLLAFEALTDKSLGGGRTGIVGNGNAVVTSITAEAISERDQAQREKVAFAWAWADVEQQNGDFDVLNVLREKADGWALGGHLGEPEPRCALLLAERPFGYEGGTRVEVTIGYQSRYAKHVVGRPRVSLARARDAAIDAFPVVASEWWLAGPFTGGDYEAVFAQSFGPGSVTELDRAQRFGEVAWQHKPDIADGTPAPLSGERAAFFLARTLHTPVPRRVALSLGSDDGIRVFLNGKEVLTNAAHRGVAADQERVEVDLPAGESVLVVEVVNDAGPAGFYCKATPVGDQPGRLGPAALLDPKHLAPKLAERYAREWNVQRSPLFARLDAKVRELDTALAKVEAEAVPVLVMKELEAPKETFVLARGRYDGADKERPVTRRPPKVLGGTLPEGAPANRLGFAQWLVRPDHPLTARVHVNRIWQMLFGRGLVESSENLGQQSDWPSHPDLLDWLALRFSRGGWDQKALIKDVVTSATYRQAAVTREDAVAADPRNRLLAYFPRKRLPGELVRDQALFVSGLLQDTIGGPSVKPYQPELWREVSIGASSNTQIFERDKGEKLWRRSLYTFWKRTSPNPQMATFDAPTREFCVVRRGTTNTPLQALILWNDEQFVEAARVLAQRTLDECSDDAARVERMFRRCTGRAPSASDRATLDDALAAWRARFAAAPADATALLKVGEAKQGTGHTEQELAAWTMLANTLLSLDETIVRD